MLGDPLDLTVRPLYSWGGRGRPSCWVACIRSLVNHQLVAEAIIRPLTQARGRDTDTGSAGPAVHVPQVQAAQDLHEVAVRLMDGWTVIVQPASPAPTLWLADTAERPGRPVEEPQNETGVRVPREGFVERLESNLSLVRSRLRHTGLRIEERRLGRRTATRLALLYIEDLINPHILGTVRSRLDGIQLDGLLESGYVEEFLEESPLSPFPQLLRTERPDTVVANLLEGRFAILTDNTPFALIGPVVLGQLLTTPEDYYERFLIGSLLRALRYAAFAISILLPALYVSVTTYHAEMIPTPLLLSIAAAREGVPFPALVEALIMELNFEVLREAGLRLPRAVGPAVSIVGALVLGQAAINANLVSPAMVIVVAITAIASFATPIFSVAIAARIIRFLFTLAGGLLGLYGVQAVAFLFLVHLVALRSFGIPYLAPVTPANPAAWKDLVVRLPWRAIGTRPEFLMPGDVVRAGRTPGGGQP